jgi:hypothetical protein
MAASDKNIANKSEDKRQKRHMNIRQGLCLPCSYVDALVARVSDYSVMKEHARSDLHLNGLPGKYFRQTVCQNEKSYIYIYIYTFKEKLGNSRADHDLKKAKGKHLRLNGTMIEKTKAKVVLKYAIDR